MSAIEQQPPPSDRRNATRIRLDRHLPLRIGRHEGFVIDLSLRGARVRHSGTLVRGSTVRIAFDWNGQRFSARAEVLASRLITLGARDGEAAAYETRLRFTAVDVDANELLLRVLQTITDDALRTWVGNLQALDDHPRIGETPRAAGYIRCRPIGSGWEKMWTRDRTQPKDGFALPAGTNPADVDALCRTWMEVEDDGRRLLQAIAEVIVANVA